MHFKPLLIATATTLLSAPAVNSCLLYNAYGFTGSSFLNAQLIDNGNKVCSFNGYPGSDGAYRFTCIAANYAAIVYDGGGTVTYANPGGNFAFQASYSLDSTGEIFYWTASNYGC
ncbi:hypothetical protein EW026_g6577 [Hermanssonia centrifuga]|uniref:Uncharacterized protein n=1 Tax=Hermanssonia centrifuga TaxID=98765 RepID=A0A4S4KCB6_9APHY|nr:hypothetical protein EW026_g6577 [Hermanssonia centrifuga]